MHLCLVTPSAWNKSSMWQVLLALLCRLDGCALVIMRLCNTQSWKP